jgi:hypothetical protein
VKARERGLALLDERYVPDEGNGAGDGADMPGSEATHAQL